MSKNIKKIIALLLAAVMLVTFCACGNKGDEETDKDTTNSAANNENVENSPAEDNNNDLGLKENEGISEEGIVFDKTLTLNGYSFLLGCDLDEFLKGANAVIAYPEHLEEFKNDKSRDTKELNCYIPYGDGKVEFNITVMHGENGNIELRGIDIFRSMQDVEEGTAEELEVFPCGFTFLGGFDVEKNQFHDLPEEILDVSKHYKDSANDNYAFVLKAAQGEPWAIVVESTNRKSSDSSFYAFYNVRVLSVP